MKTIHLTTAHHEEIESKLNVYKKLNLENINISDYSELEKLVVVFQAYNPNSKAVVAKERKTMRRKKATLELYLVLDYDRITQGSEAENLQHIKEVFVKGCETFLKPLKGFEWEAFYEQLSGL